MTKIVSNIPVSQNFLPEVITQDHYVLGDGNLSAQVLMPNGHGWGKHLPLGESQLKNGVDPQSCPAGGTLNAIEAIGKLKYGASFQNDLSERYLSIISGMDGHGGYPHQVAEVMRTIAGAIPEVFLPFDKTITDNKKYFSPRPITYALFKIGYNWLQKYILGHQWLVTGNEPLIVKQSSIKQGLKYSPVGVSGYAWSLHSDGMYYHDGPDIHWYTIFDYVEDSKGKLLYWLAFDTYEPYIKKIGPNYNFGYAKGYTLDRKLGGNSKSSDELQSAIIPYIIYRIKNLFKKP